MNYLFYLDITIITFLGLLAGITLGAVSPEEVVPGRRWLLMLKKGLYLLLAMFVLYYHHSIFETALVLLMAGLGYLLLNYRIIYTFLGIVLGILFFSPIFIHVATIIFLFGLPAGSLMASTRKDATLFRMLKGTVRVMALRFIVPVLLVPLAVLLF